MTTTVVLACYNGQRFILEQLESIRLQTVQPDEVLICDDCSQDNTVEIVQDYINQNKLHNWSIEVNEKNLGWRVNFANLILKAKMDIIFLCDQDDIWYPNKIEVLLEALENDNSANLVVSDMNVKYFTDDIANLIKYCPQIFGNKYYQHLPLKAKWKNIMRPGCAYAVRREFAQYCFTHCWDKYLAHDIVLWQCAFFSDSIGYVHVPLFDFRRFEESTTMKRISSEIQTKKELQNEIICSINSFLDHAMYTSKICECDKYYSKKGKRIAEGSLILERKRVALMKNRSVLMWLSCILQIDCYAGKKGWIRDFILLYCRR